MSDEERDPTLRVAIDLREIARLADMLEDQAFHHANDRELPGGDAMAALLPVANLAAFENKVDGAERWNLNPDNKPRDLSHLEDQDEETALQLLEFWWERWVFELDGDCDRDLALRDASEWLAKPDVLAWAKRWDARFDLFADDVAKARRLLENTLLDGDRSVFGIQCPKCHERSLVRVTEPRLSRRRCAGHGHRQICPWPMPQRHGCSDRGGLQEVWECPHTWLGADGETRKCGHRMQLADYESAVMRDYIANAPYLRAEHVERRTFVKPGTVRQWASRGYLLDEDDQSSRRYVRTRRDSEDRVTFCVEDVEEARDRDRNDHAQESA